MGYSSKYDTSEELLIQPWNGGVRLIEPHPELSGISVGQMLAMPFNVYFKNNNSINLNVNETTVQNNGFLSKKDAIGKSSRDVATSDSAEFIIEHDKTVLSLKSLIMRDEHFVRLRDNAKLQKLAIKLPWYHADNEVIGLFGCSIVIGKESSCSFTEALSSLIKMGLLSRPANTDPLTAALSFSIQRN